METVIIITAVLAIVFLFLTIIWDVRKISFWTLLFFLIFILLLTISIKLAEIGLEIKMKEMKCEKNQEMKTRVERHPIELREI